MFESVCVTIQLNITSRTRKAEGLTFEHRTFFWYQWTDSLSRVLLLKEEKVRFFLFCTTRKSQNAWMLDKHFCKFFFLIFSGLHDFFFVFFGSHLFLMIQSEKIKIFFQYYYSVSLANPRKLIQIFIIILFHCNFHENKLFFHKFSLLIHI